MDKDKVWELVKLRSWLWLACKGNNFLTLCMTAIHCQCFVWQRCVKWNWKGISVEALFENLKIGIVTFTTRVLTWWINFPCFSRWMTSTNRWKVEFLPWKKWNKRKRLNRLKQLNKSSDRSIHCGKKIDSMYLLWKVTFWFVFLMNKFNLTHFMAPHLTELFRLKEYRSVVSPNVVWIIILAKRF